MIESDEISHPRRTARLWAMIGKEVARSESVRHERRGRPRFLVADALCRLDILGETAAASMDVAVRDVSSVGACLLATAALPVAAGVRLHPPDESASGAGTVEGQVTYCRPTEGQFRIGVRFADRPATAVETSRQAAP